MNKLFESVNKNKLFFEHVGNSKYVSFYEHMDSKELFDEIEYIQLRFDDALKNKKSCWKNKWSNNG